MDFFTSATASSCSHLPVYFPSHSSSSILEKTSFSSRTHLSFQSKLTDKSSFVGRNLVFQKQMQDYYNPVRTLACHPITAAVKRRKELPFDNVIQRDKKLKLVLKIRKILVSQPDRTMALRELGKYRRELGLTRKRRFIALLKRFPAVFEIVEEGVFSLKFKLTPEAERNYLEELKVRNQMEDPLVVKLRKLLMMSLEKRILLEKIAHLRTDLGLPLEFRDTICQRYPQYFKMVPTSRGPALELTHWDPELAVSFAESREEENRIKEQEEKNLIIDRPPKFNRVKLPKGLNLSKSEMRRICQFRDIPFTSPYADFSELKPSTPEKEKHACGVIHEMLSLTVEKRTLVDHLTHFREEFRFSQQLRGMLIRHPDMFYVSLKGERDSVFLRDAYHNSQLIEKDRLLLIKEKLRALASVPRFTRRIVSKTDVVNGSKEEGSGVANEELSNAQGSGDEFDDDGVYEGDDEGDEEDDWSDEGEEDDWSDEEEEIPPDFNNEGVNFGERKPLKAVSGASATQEKKLEPVFPDGRPRECW